MEEATSAFTTINNEVSSIEDDTQRWKLLYYKYSKFAIQYPMIALCIAMGHYNESAVVRFLKKVKACIKGAMNQEEYIELHSHYAKYLYMATNNHYDNKRLQEFTRGAAETLKHLLDGDEKEDYGPENLYETKTEILEVWRAVHSPSD